jgi:predicted dehydrogenase
MKQLGYIGVAHIHTPGFVQRLNARTDEFTVKAVWDSDPARAKVVAEHLNTVVADSLDEILNDSDIEAVVIASETNVHEDLVAKVAAAGKHMFVEKPLGMKAEDAYAMQKSIDDAGVIFQTGFFMRGQPHHLFIKKLIEDGTLGQITRIRHSNVHSGSIGQWFDAGKGWFEDGWMWMTREEEAGVGAYGDLGAHSIDILMWLMGGVEKVTAQVDVALDNYSCDEFGEGLIRFKNGVIGTLAAGWVDIWDPVRIQVNGTQGTVFATGDGKVYLKTDNIDGADGSEWTDLPEALPHAFDLYLDALNGKDVPLVTAKEAADRVAVMEAMYVGAVNNTWAEPKS